MSQFLLESLNFYSFHAKKGQPSSVVASFNFLHFTNANFETNFNLLFSENCIFSKFIQLQKANSSIICTESGILIVLSD